MIEIPESWRWASLNDLQANEPRAITDGPFGSNLTSAHYTEAGPRVVRLQNIGDGDFIDSRAHISQEHFERLRAHEVLAGDLLIASLGERPPRACLAPPQLGPAIVKADCIRVRLAASVDRRWVLHALRAPSTRRWAADKLHGVGRPRLGLKTIRALPIPLPPLHEQQRLVQLLEDHLSTLSAAAAGLARTRERTRRFAEATIERAVGGSWETLTIGELAVVGSGATPLRANSAYYDGGTVPWVTSGALGGAYVSEPTEYITELALSETAVKVWPKGTLLVAMYGEGRTRGRCSELTFASTTNQACAAIVLRGEFEELRTWLKLVLRSRYQQMRRMAVGGVQPNLSLGIVKSMRIPVPPADVRSSALAGVAAADAAASRLITQATAAIGRGDVLIETLFDNAVTGKFSAWPLAGLVAR
jgi:type I restriction enzyme S subunit